MDIKSKEKKALLKAKDRLGTWAKLAELCGVSQPIAWNWYHRNKTATPPEHVLKIEGATGVSRHDLCPDVFGKPPKTEKGK